ncbi:MAG: peptidoglycan-binding domain-containing protein [Candidatus Melainabacteria bacterium]|nr:peptidoglycan-binding domain-containing protein [Candidatus Melainabacteria bacterium]
MRKKTDYIVIHCSDTPPSMDIGAKEIDRWHRSKGWFRIGYHFVIRRDGTVELGRELNEVGAHTLHYNDRSVGVCLVGGMQEDRKKSENNFTQAQWETLDKLIGELEQQFPQAKVLGHRDLNRGRDCPCFDVQNWMTQRARPTQQDQAYHPLVYSVLKQGARGPLVRSLQAKLNRWYGIAVDGLFGMETKNAVQAFQRKERLIDDGIVGPRTWSALLRYE